MITEDILEWVATLPKWQQKLSYVLVEKKKVTEEEVENGAKKVKVEKIVPKMKKITPKRVKVPQTEEVKEEVKEEPVEVVEETVVENVETIVTEEAPKPKQKAAKKTVVETIIEDDDVTVEKTSDGVVEVKKHESNQTTAEELSIEQKLLSLYNLQQICTKIDDIRMIRGELPEEIRDNEDECEGLNTRINKFTDDIKNLKLKIASENTNAEEARATIKKYEEQQNSVRNNREYEALSKEIEFQQLQIQIAEKHKEKHEAEILDKQAKIAETNERLKELQEVLEQKKAELEVIVADTQKEEDELLVKAEELRAKVDDRLLTAFERIRKNAHNGLAIVKIERDACGGCFSKIPPQRQLDICLHKKIIVCEACGRIFIDDKLVREHQNDEQ